MDFVAEKSELFQELQYVQGVVERKATVPILSNLLLEVEQDRVTITSTDLDVTVRCSCSAKSEGDGAIAISARKLVDIVRLLPDAPVHIRSDGEGWIKLSCERSHFRIAGLSKDNFPEVPSVTSETIALPAPALRYMINQTIFAVTQEESRYALNGGLLVISPSSLALVTTDGHRLAMIRKALEFEGLEEELRILVPKKSLVELAKMSEGVESVEFGRTDNHLFFRMGERLLVSRVLTGQFPNFEMVIPKENHRRLCVNREEVGAALKRVQLMAEEQTRSVKMAMVQGEVTISAANAEHGEAREVVPAEYEGDPMEMSFNAQYLLDYLTGLSVDEVYIDLKDAETQGLIMPKDGGDYTQQYVVMPMKH